MILGLAEERKKFPPLSCHLRPIYRDELMKFIINQYHSCHGDNVSFPTVCRSGGIGQVYIGKSTYAYVKYLMTRIASINR
jgi:hypothetical protein